MTERVFNALINARLADVCEDLEQALDALFLDDDTPSGERLVVTLARLGKAYLDYWSEVTGDGSCWEQPLHDTITRFKELVERVEKAIPELRQEPEFR